jgi:hypothetical protein
LHNGVIEDYAVHQIAGNTSSMTLSGAEGQQRQIDVSLAAEYKDYDGLEPVFAAIFDSIHFD